MVLADDRFDRWTLGKDAVGRRASPIELLLLGALRYLGIGLTFDDLEEYTAISEETHRQFLHVFIEYGATFLYSKYFIIQQQQMSTTITFPNLQRVDFPVQASHQMPQMLLCGGVRIISDKHIWG